MVRRVTGVVALLIASVIGVTAQPAGAATSYSIVNYLYAGPLTSVPVDVCIDGVEVATDLASGDATGTLMADATTVDLVVALHEAVDCASKATVFIDVAGAEIVEGGILYLYNGANDSGGAQPEWGVLPGPECIAAGTSRLTLVHAANYGPVDVLVDGAELVGDLTNGQYFGIDLPGGTSAPIVEVVPAGGGTPIVTVAPFGPLAVEQETIVSVVGGVGPVPAEREYGVEEMLRALEQCPPPPTTAPPTTAPAATVTPAFTG